MFESNVHVYAIFVFVLSLIALEKYNPKRNEHPLAKLSIEQLVELYDYPFESHEVITEDGYILTLHRIPSSRKNNTKRVPVLLMHGFTQSAKDFVNVRNRSLAFLLSENGYDVWLGNVRGCTYSKKHKFLDATTNKTYWDFSFHEIAVHDISSFIDYILYTTKEENLHYIGYSQGTTLFFILGAEKPEYTRKVRLMTALAPAMFLNGTRGPVLNTLKYFQTPFEFLAEMFNLHHILHEDTYLAKYAKQICHERSLFLDICLYQLSLLHGFNYEEVNMPDLSLIFSSTPAGGSARQIFYIMQLMRSGKFIKYDFGDAENLEKYGQKVPPHYQVSRIQTPVALYYAANDWTVNDENVERIKHVLPNVVKSYLVPMESFNHNDFIYAKNVVSLLYQEVINTMLKY